MTLGERCDTVLVPTFLIVLPVTSGLHGEHNVAMWTSPFPLGKHQKQPSSPTSNTNVENTAFSSTLWDALQVLFNSDDTIRTYIIVVGLEAQRGKFDVLVHTTTDRVKV